MNWLEGKFNVDQIVDQLCYDMSRTRWNKYLENNAAGANLMNQLVAHCVCCVRIKRNQIVPGSEAAQGVVTWQDLENDGLAYIGTPGWLYEAQHLSCCSQTRVL